MSATKFFQTIFNDIENKNSIFNINNNLPLINDSAYETIKFIKENPNSDIAKNYQQNIEMADKLEEKLMEEKYHKNQQIKKDVQAILENEKEKIEKEIRDNYKGESSKFSNEKFIETVMKNHHKWKYTQYSTPDDITTKTLENKMKKNPNLTMSQIYASTNYKTAFNPKNPSKWNGDCNDFLAEYIKQSYKTGKSGLSKEEYEFYTNARAGKINGNFKKEGVPLGASGIAYAAETLNKKSDNGDVLKNKEISYKDLKDGVLISLKPQGKEEMHRVKGRYNGINHVAVCVEYHDKKYIMEFAGTNVGFRVTPADKWLEMKKEKGYEMTACSLSPDNVVNNEEKIQEMITNKMKERENELLAKNGFDQKAEYAYANMLNDKKEKLMITNEEYEMLSQKINNEQGFDIQKAIGNIYANIGKML